MMDLVAVVVLSNLFMLDRRTRTLRPYYFITLYLPEAINVPPQIMTITTNSQINKNTHCFLITTSTSSQFIKKHSTSFYLFLHLFLYTRTAQHVAAETPPPRPIDIQNLLKLIARPTTTTPSTLYEPAGRQLLPRMTCQSKYYKMNIIKPKYKIEL